MKKRLFFIIAALLALKVNYKAQVTILPDETLPLNFTQIYNGDFNYGYGTLVNFDKAKGMLTIGTQMQSDGTATWNEIRVAFYYNGTWYKIYELWSDQNNIGGGYPPTYSAYNYTNTPTTYPVMTTTPSGLRTKVTSLNTTNSPGTHQSIYMYNNGNLKRYNGSYLPIGGDVQFRNNVADNANFSIQTAVYAANQAFPLSNPGNNGNLPVPNALTAGALNFSFGNLPGLMTLKTDATHSGILINLTNLPPDMLEAPSFRVHIYVNSNTNHDAIYETVYNNSNFMTSPPNALTASQNVCGKVSLSWGNSGANILPNGTLTVKNVIFRNNAYLATVAGTVTTYDDLTAAQDVVYNYTVRHVAFTETGHTYYRSPPTPAVSGQVKPSPDPPISAAASSNKCNGIIDLTWNYNGVNPDKFKIDYSLNPSGPFLPGTTVAGTARSLPAGATRGLQYYYKIYAISTCSVVSLTSSDCNGISPSDPAMATGITATPNGSGIDVAWNDNANNETKYEIVRTDDLGNTILTQINANSTTYTDNSAAACRAYTYKVRVYNDCVLSGIISSTSASATLPPPNLGSTFTSTKKLVASKGYFGNRVELSWSNNNGVNIDIFKIYRKQLGTSLDSVQIASLGTGNALYVDNTADARVFYRYTIVGVKTCNGSELLTNISSDIGFRNPTGLVSGHVEYNGGVAVSGAKVLIQPSGTNVGSSLNFASGGLLVVQDDPKLEPGAQLRCEFWLKPIGFSGVCQIVTKSGAFDFYYDGANYIGRIIIGGVPIPITVSPTVIAPNQWSHVSMVYDGVNFKMFANGVFQNYVTVSGSIDDVGNPLVFGGASSNFLIDEFRLIGLAQPDAIISTEYQRILNGNETNFKCNLHFDEGTGNYAYDPSKVGNLFNANHGLLSGNVVWSNDRPTGSQLGYFGVTDALGNYNASGIRFIGTGENFNIVPQYQTHSFSPNSRSVYIGDASQVFNNQDFTDISSFPFSGTLFYKGTTCPVPNVGLKIDGLPVVSNGQQAVTDAAGNFSISVPIGNHYVSAELFNHYMEAGRYPATGTHNFQAPISGVQFTDSTLVTLVGRIVGGKTEADKAPGLGRSKNNIGKARLRIVTPLTGSPCFTTATITNSTTGEYILRVPPLAYKIDSAYVITNSVVISKANLSNTSQVLDLTSTLIQMQSKDTLKDSFGGVVSVDSIYYHKRYDMIYRNTPIVDVTMLDGSKLIGDDTLKAGTVKIPLKPISTNTTTTGSYGWGPFNWPIFSQDNVYSMKINANEIYTNTDNGAKDTVALTGDIHVTNQMVNGIDPNANISFDNGSTTYSFVCGSPNTANNNITPALSYARDIQIVVVPDGSSSVSWLPNAVHTPTNKNFHGIVIGKRITGTGIATQGPEKVDFILRDPPGSGSSSTWATGTSVTKASDFKIGGGVDTEMSATIELGLEMSVGIGVETETEVDVNASIGLTTSTSAFSGQGFSETITSSNAVSTRDDADNVGAPADIFIGRSRNWLVGPTANVELVNAGSTPLCFGPVVSGKQLARNTGFAISPSDVKTRFSYTQNEIETVVIPGLEAIRNTILTTRPQYTNIANPPDPLLNPLFGSNNDDPLWLTDTSSSTPSIYEPRDTIGRSYVFRGYKAHVQDTVRILNTQIALWKQTLAQNEREKLSCKNNTAGVLIDNFTLGSAIVTNAYATDKEESTSLEWELALSGSIASAIGAEVGGVGVEVGASITLNESQGGSESQANTNSTSFEYTLTDGDPGDIMSIDVYKLGSGNVFITRGGQTMCPYEDAIVCHYYNPANPNAWISSHTYNENGFTTIANATVQREIPDIQINPTTQLNIPSNQAAVYQLLLSNQSPLTVNNDIDLQVRIASASNPYGAILKIDGLSANTIINIPSGGSVIKTLTIERGPIEINYDSLMVIFSSACSEDIADTAYVSVHFIPTCTDLSINTPVDNFVINNSNNNLANVVIDDYNYNYGDVANTIQVPTGTYTYVATSTNTLTGITTTAVATGTNYANVPVAAHPNYGFEKIGFEIKPANSSQWLQIQDFYKVVSAAQAAGTNTVYSIPQGQVYTQYNWTVTPNSYADGNYEIRAKSYCYNKDGSYAVVYSPVHSGVMDRVNPAPFGTPSPGDGILDPNDDISIKFNEPIDISSLSYAPITNASTGNFDIRGVLNETNIRHSESLNFDGTSNYAEVTGGAGLQKRPFTFEFWAKFNSTGAEQTVISQGTDLNQNMTIGFDATNRLKFTLGNQTALSTNPVSLPTDWHHYALTYDYQNSDASLYIDGSLSGINNNFLIDYIGSGKLAFGKSIPSNTNYFNGNIHEVRLWNKVRSISEITMTMNKVLNRNQSGLVYNWKMDEADGSFANDDIRSRNATIYGATWEVNPNGNAVQFDGVDDHLQVSSGNIAINKEMDFTLEFWFNSNQAGVSTLFSNGAGVANTADSLNAWTIQKDATGKIHVYHKGLDFVATTTNYFDNKWHHFALVMNRSANLSAYIDGNLQNSVQGINFNNLAGANLYLGAKATVAGATTTLSDYYTGKMDEFRLWNTARKTEQIKRDKQNRMLGNESGLLAFVPFENYALVLGTPSLTPTFNNQSQNTLTVSAQNGLSLIAQTPTIKLPRPVQSVNYNWSLNNDQIILSTTTAPELIENVTLDVTVQNAYDMRGNKMQSPKTWIAYINKNQVKWQDDQYDFEKTVDSLITFVAPIVNSGGAQKAFTIGGLPSWMTASITNGVIAPNSIQNITFTIPAGQSVGDYNAEVTVTTDFNYDEVLQINLKVKGIVPTWTVNTAAYQYQMNVFGQLKLDGVISSNTDSKLAAMCNGVVRGVANLQYVPAYDKYEVFLNIYSNTVSGDSIYFNIYDGATGLTFVTVDSSLTFVYNEVLGTISNPRIFSANTEISRDIPLNAGWTWVSFPLKTNKMVNSNSMMKSINGNTGDIVTSISDYDQYDNSLGWLGNISSSTGYKNNQSYKIKKAVADTLVHIGSRLNPDSSQAKINVVPGWNWIGFISNKNLPINEALGNYNSVTGDLVKSQYQFAYYDNLTGWNGSLTHMKPTMGYMLKSSSTSSFNYPLSGFLSARLANTESTANNQEVFPFVPEQYSNTMSMIIKGNICNDALAQGNVAVGVFDSGNNLRGYAYPTTTNLGSVFYLTAYSNLNTEELSIKYFNTTDASVIATNTTVTFSTDVLVGSPSKPFIANVDESLSCQVVNITTGIDALDNSLKVSVYPNPFSEQINLQFNKTVDAKLELVDVLGKVIYTSTIKGKKEVVLTNYNLADGIYYIRLTGDINKQIKVVKTK